MLVKIRGSVEISLQVNKILDSKLEKSKFKSASMQFHELIQSSLTKHVNIALDSFTFQDRCNKTPLI